MGYPAHSWWKYSSSEPYKNLYADYATLSQSYGENTRRFINNCKFMQDTMWKCNKFIVIIINCYMSKGFIIFKLSSKNPVLSSRPDSNPSPSSSGSELSGLATASSRNFTSEGPTLAEPKRAQGTLSFWEGPPRGRTPTSPEAASEPTALTHYKK